MLLKSLLMIYIIWCQWLELGLGLIDTKPNEQAFFKRFKKIIHNHM